MVANGAALRGPADGMAGPERGRPGEGQTRRTRRAGGNCCPAQRAVSRRGSSSQHPASSPGHRPWSHPPGSARGAVPPTPTHTRAQQAAEPRALAALVSQASPIHPQT